MLYTALRGNKIGVEAVYASAEQVNKKKGRLTEEPGVVRGGRRRQRGLVMVGGPFLHFNKAFFFTHLNRMKNNVFLKIKNART